MKHFFIILNSKQNFPGCGADIIPPKAICYTNIFEKLIWAKGQLASLLASHAVM